MGKRVERPLCARGGSVNGDVCMPVAVGPNLAFHHPLVWPWIPLPGLILCVMETLS